MKCTVFLMTLLAALAGCGQAPGLPAPLETPAERAETDSVLARLGSLRKDAFVQAFDALQRHTYRRYSRTEQFDEGDFLVAFVEREVRHAPDGTARVIREDSAGAFDFGLFKSFVSTRAPSLDPVDLVPLLFPEEPAYLAPRNREYYRYRLLPDTLLWDRTAHVLDVRARPEAGDGQSIRHARYFIDRASGELIALSMARIDLSMLFREESRFFLQIRPLPSGGWVPFNTRFETRLKMPFEATRRFRTVGTILAVED